MTPKIELSFRRRSASQQNPDPNELIIPRHIVEKVVDDEGNEKYLPIKGIIKIISSGNGNRSIIPAKAPDPDQPGTSGLAKPKPKNSEIFTIDRAKLRGPISLISLDSQNIELCERYVDEAGNLQERIWQEIKIGTQNGI
jgi:hypothetical protein